MRPLKIAILMMEPPLPTGNAISRWLFVLVKSLAQRGHNITAMVSCKNQDLLDRTTLFYEKSSDKNSSPGSIWGESPEEVRKRVSVSCYLAPQNNSRFSKFNPFASPHENYFSDAFKYDLEVLNNQGLDIIHVEQLWTGLAAIPFAEKSLLNVHHLLSIDLANVEADQWVKRYEIQREFLAEEKIVKGFQFIRSCSPNLVRFIHSWNKSAYVETVPVAINLDMYPFATDEYRQSKKEQKLITLIGNLKWYPTRSAARRLLNDLWPPIKSLVPDCRLRIVGWDARKILPSPPSGSDIEIIENVDDIVPYFTDASLLLYPPPEGGGMKIKILESMAYGLPIVTTTHGVEGLPVVDGVHMGISDEKDGLIKRAVELVTDVGRQNTYRKNARELVESHCGPENTTDQIERLYEKILTHVDDSKT